ncbi:MAG: MTH1187 family thiamine-binding protein [Bacillota bacterium]|nr:MTH1187 family thiamine-binding protein [Bacillota bacterium]
MAIVAVSIAPLGTGETSVSRFVAAAERVLQEEAPPGVRYRLDPMFTTLEGDLATIFRLVQRMEEAVVAEGARRVDMVIKVDDRRDRPSSMEAKVRSVEEKLGR